MRVRLMEGLPKQMFGSSEILRSNFSRFTVEPPCAIQGGLCSSLRTVAPHTVSAIIWSTLR